MTEKAQPRRREVEARSSRRGNLSRGGVGAGRPVLLREMPGAARSEAAALAQQMRRMADALYRWGGAGGKDMTGAAPAGLYQRLLGAARRLQATDEPKPEGAS